MSPPPSLAGHFIAEPGVDLTIWDAQSHEIFLGAFDYYLREPTDQTTSARQFIDQRFPLPFDVTVPFQTTATGSASPGADYLPVSGTVRIPAGETQAVFGLPLLPDRIPEDLEHIGFRLGRPSYGVLSEPSGEFLLPLSDSMVFGNSLPRVPVIFEPVSGSATFTIPVKLANAPSKPMTVGYWIAHGTTAAGDIQIVTAASVTVPAGMTTVPIPLTVFADALTESAETATLRLTNLDGVALDPIQAQTQPLTVTIHDRPTIGAEPDAFTCLQNVPLEVDPSRSVRINDAAGLGNIEGVAGPETGAVVWQADGTFRYVPAPNFIGVDHLAYRGTIGGETLISSTAGWRWLHPLNGQDPGALVAGFQSNWMKPAFDDSTWSSGTGLMGYGTLGAGAGQAITTDIGTPAANRYTAYFRTPFTAPAAVTGMAITFSCDDAAIFYLNGAEVGRFERPPVSAFFTNSDTYRLLSGTVLDAAEETELRTMTLPFAQVQSGTNTLAISVHNGSSSSSDLGLRVSQVVTGFTTQAVSVSITVSDEAAPPVLADDTYTAPTTTTPLNSLFLAGGSAYANDGLLSSAGTAYDPILEVQVGGGPVGPVEFDKDTGQFSIAAPPGFFGATSFTYRVRDKDGWSAPAQVTLNVIASRAFDVWRQARFGGGSANAQSDALADPDEDGTANFLEFAFGLEPRIPEPAPLLEIKRAGGVWVIEFLANPGFGQDGFIGLETSSSLSSGTWTRVAWLNDAYPTVEVLAPGVSKSRTTNGGLIRYSIELPPNANPHGFFRGQTARERHLLDP